MSSGFVSEKVLEDKRRERQEEWERVRKPEEPELAPEEPHDSRSLFDQLQANKAKAQEEWDDAHKLKNQIRGIDDDEAEFLDEVDHVRTSVERQRRLEERLELESYRKGQAELRERELEERLQARPVAVRKNSNSGASSSSSSQSKLLLAAVKRSAPPASKKEEEAGAKVAKVGGNALGALAVLGDYDSSSDEDS